VTPHSVLQAGEIAELLRRVIPLAFSDMVMATGLGAIDLQGRQVELSGKLKDFVSERVDNEFGLVITEVTMNISLPEQITQAMTAGVARGVEQKGYLSNLGPVDRYQQVAAADAMVAAAGNPGGSAMGDFMQAGMGMAMAGQMAGALQGAMAPGAATTAPAAAGPPPLPGQPLFHVDMGNGQSGGPFNVQQVQAGIANGQVVPATLVWAPGMAAWAPANTVAALRTLFVGPPPMPGAVPPAAPPA